MMKKHLLHRLMYNKKGRKSNMMKMDKKLRLKRKRKVPSS